MIRSTVTLAALLLSASALAATNATITRIDGEVMVNQGEQFVPAQPGQVLISGDRLLVQQGASSTLTFEDGCVLDVPGDTLVVVPDTSTCADARAAQVTPKSTGAVGGSGGSAAAAGGDSAFGWGYLGTVAAVVLFYRPGGGDEEDTASP